METNERRILSGAIVVAGGERPMLERFAIAGFLASYSGPTRQSYQTDLRMFSEWLTARRSGCSGCTRPYRAVRPLAREQGRARATVGRRLSTLAGFYRYCEQEEILPRSPAAHIRRPKQDYESHTLGLDRNELGGFLVAAGLSCNRDHALASLLALNGLRISEALGARYRAALHRTRPSHAADPAQGRQTGDDPARPAYREGDRSVCRRTRSWSDLSRGARSADGPPCRHPDGPPPVPHGGDHQAHLAALAAPQLHHRRARRRGPAA